MPTPLTFPFTPSYAPVDSRKPRVLSARFGDGYEQRAADGINPDLQAWKLNFGPLRTKDADAVEAFLIRNNVASDPFYWSPPRPYADYYARTWEKEVNPVDNNWVSVTYSIELGLYVAVASSGGTDRVMTSPDGKTWTIGTMPSTAGWTHVLWISTLGLFVACASSAVASGFATSPDGRNWTLRSSPDSTGGWQQMAYGAGLIVAIRTASTGTRVATSPDGIVWTNRTSAADIQWISVCYSPELHLFVAVADSVGTGNRVMTSPDGIAWTIGVTPADLTWRAVAWNGRIFAALSSGTSGVMTSPDGFAWTQGTMPNGNTSRCIAWNGVVFAGGQINAGVGNRVVTSPDGFTWTAGTSTADNNWTGICAAGAQFCAVAATGTGDRVMLSIPTPRKFLCRNWERATTAYDTDELNAVFEEVADP